MLWEAILQANESSGVDTLLLRRTFEELEDSLISKFRREVPREMYQSYNESKHVVRWHNGSTTRFGYCRNESDVYQYQGAEFLFIGIDELTLFTLKMWLFLTSCNRCAVPGTFPNMAGATNPGNIGHEWVRKLFGCAGPGERMEKGAAPGMEAETYDPRDYAFIPALVSDNPIYANDAGYLKTLAHLPKFLREAYLKGLWNVFAGQYFDIWDPAVMVERPEAWELKPWWPKWISIDWGFEHPSAVYWHTIDDSGRTLTYREFVRNRMAPRELAKKIIALSLGSDAGGEHEKISDIFLSPDAFAHRTDEATIAEQIGDELSRSGHLPRPSRADDDRVGGWMLMYQMLQSGHWLIGQNCKELISRIPAAIRDEKHVEDIAKFDAVSGEGGDDPLDSARYGLKSRHSPGRKPLDVRLKERIAVYAATRYTKVEEMEPQSVAMLSRRALALESKHKRSRRGRIWHPQPVGR